MITRTDEELVVEYLAGDEQAFAELVERYTSLLYHFLARQVSMADGAAEDLTQEVFLRIWRNLKKFDQTKKFRVWAFRIARNVCIDFWRKKKNIPFSSLADPENGEDYLERIVDPEPLPQEVLQRQEFQELLQEAIARLPDPQRLAVVLRLENDLTFREIADVLEEPLDTVKSRYRRGLLALRKLLVRQ